MASASGHRFIVVPSALGVVTCRISLTERASVSQYAKWLAINIILYVGKMFTYILHQQSAVKVRHTLQAVITKTFTRNNVSRQCIIGCHVLPDIVMARKSL